MSRVCVSGDGGHCIGVVVECVCRESVLLCMYNIQ